jgi:hypothetical protein
MAERRGSLRYQVGSGNARQQRWHEYGTLSETKSLATACAEAKRIRSRVADGEDPSKPELTTFGELFGGWLEQHAKKKLATWRDERRRYEMYLGGPRAIDEPPEDVAPFRLSKTLALGPRVFAEIERSARPNNGASNVVWTKTLDLWIHSAANAPRGKHTDLPLMLEVMALVCVN